MHSLMKLTLSFTPAENYCWITRLTKRFENSFVKVMQLDKNHDSGSYQMLFEILAPNNVSEVISHIKGDKALADLHLVSIRRGRIYGYAKALCAESCPLARVSCALLRSVTTNKNNELHWNFIGNNIECRMIMQRLAEQGVFFKVVELSIIKENGNNKGITGKQELVVKVAYELGYFDYPKKVNIRELAELFKLTPATISEEIRKGLKKILGQYFQESSPIELEDKYRSIIEENYLS